MELSKRECIRLHKIVENLGLLHRLAFVHGVSGVLTDIMQREDEILQAQLKGDKPLLVSAVKLASRAIPHTAALLIPRLAGDLRQMVLEDQVLNHLKQYEVLLYDIKRLASML